MNLLDFYIPEEILVALSLLILLFVLKRIFWKPVMKIIDNRQKGVDAMLQGAEDAQRIITEMKKQRASHDEELERQVITKMKEARERAGREYDRIIAEAEEKAHKLLETGEERARREYQQIMGESQEAIIALSLSAASKIVETSMDSEKNRKLIETMLQKAGVSHE
jgi:F-type H+-transporting ATPase subunit b